MFSLVKANLVFSLLLLSVAHPRSKHLDHLKYYEVLDYDTLHVEKEHHRVQRSSPGKWWTSDTLFIEFNAHNRNFLLELTPNKDPYVANSRVHLIGEGGTKKIYLPEELERNLYHGKVKGDPTSYVHGYIQDGVFDGVVTTSGETFHLEGSWKFYQPEQRVGFHSIIYKASDVMMTPQGEGGEANTSYCGHLGELQKYLKELQSSTDFSEKQQVRRKRQSSQGTVCRLRIAADSRFYSSVGSSQPTVVRNEITTVLNAVNQIYVQTDFDLDGTADGLKFYAPDIEIFTTSTMPNSQYASDGITVNSFLDLWSQENHNSYCLALLFTYRDFAQGVLGLAWVAEPNGGNIGGVCQERVTLSSGQRNLNTAIVTYLNFGQRQSREIGTVTVAHEFGHNFGSPHDPVEAGICSPGGSSGNYLMYPRATDGSLSNNKRFSTCSRSYIRDVLRDKSGCFISGIDVCGNGIIENDEECDCGSTEDVNMCNTGDSCCNLDCTLKSSAQCTPKSNEPCCTEQCQFTLQSADQLCSAETDCTDEVFCNGMTASCVVDVENGFKPDGTLCSEGSRTCRSGGCTGSICSTIGATECECNDMSKPNQFCHVCCQTENGCQSSGDIADSRIDLTVKGSDRSCNSFNGLCNRLSATESECVPVNNEDFIDILTNLFNEETLNEVLLWLQTFWYIPVGVIVVIAAVVILLPLTYRKKPLSKLKTRVNTLRRRATLRSGRHDNIQQAQTGGVGANSRGGRAARRDNVYQPRRLTESEAIKRIKCFIPHAEDGLVRGTLRQKGNESGTVKALLEMGFPLKKQNVDILPIHT